MFWLSKVLLFVPIGQVKYRGFIPGFPHDLESQWKSTPVKTAWNAYGRQTIVVGEYSILRRECLRVDTCVVNGRNGGCRGWQQKNVNVFKGLASDAFSVGLDIG